MRHRTVLDALCFACSAPTVRCLRSISALCQLPLRMSRLLAAPLACCTRRLAALRPLTHCRHTVRSTRHLTVLDARCFACCARTVRCLRAISALYQLLPCASRLLVAPLACCTRHLAALQSLAHDMPFAACASLWGPYTSASNAQPRRPPPCTDFRKGGVGESGSLPQYAWHLGPRTPRDTLRTPPDCRR